MPDILCDFRNANIYLVKLKYKPVYSLCTGMTWNKMANWQYINKKGIHKDALKSTGYVRDVYSDLSCISVFTDSICMILCSNNSFCMNERFFAFVL